MLKLKQIFFTVFLSACFSVLLFAQSTFTSLISINPDQIKSPDQLEKIGLRINHQSESEILSLANSDQLSELNNLNLSYKIIDQTNGSDKYYIITSRSANSDYTILRTQKIIFKGSDYFIVKNIANETDLVRDGYRIADITNSQQFFKTEKSVYGSDSNLNDPEIQDIISAVNKDSVEFFIQSLQDFQTRFLLADNRDAVANWIKSQFTRFGFTDVVLDSFQYQNTWQKNVVATLPGTLMPERVLVYGGHHDSYSSGNPSVFAPGADDNASGTAAVLEMARVMKLKNFNPECTIKFITFAAEEYGLWGSKHFADNAYNTGMDIRLMINHDMISHKYSGSQYVVDINSYTGSISFAALAQELAGYGGIIALNGSTNSSGSDSYSFWQKGYNAIYFEENEFSPYYHSPQDIISNYDMEYCSRVIKASGALLIAVNKMPTQVTGLKLYDPGTGYHILAQWNPNGDADFSHFRVEWSSMWFDDFEETTDTSLVLSVPSAGINYWVSVFAVDSNGNKSMMLQKQFTPNIIPLAPINLVANPGLNSVGLVWNKNLELDISGYNIYRAESESGPFGKLNSQPIADTLFTDVSPVSYTYYYYYIKAVDQQSNESEQSIIVKARSVTLDKGIILIDETVDGTGTFSSPTDEMVDEFYNFILSDYLHADFDMVTEGIVDLSAIGAYSTVIWAGDDYGNYPPSSQVMETIKQYLVFGGNIIYSGYRPSRLFSGISNNNNGFQPGSFVYDYLKIDSSIYVNAGRFKGALSSYLQYPNISIDSAKVFPSLNYHLIGVESILPNNQGTTIYNYNTDYDTTTNQGLLKGKPVGVEYIGTNYKSVILSFPLYFTNINEAKLLMNYILEQRIGEVSDVEEAGDQLPEMFFLEQNYPNPFNPVTNISFSIKEKSNVELTVYDILGRKAALLLNEEKLPGYYNIKFDASSLSSGVYFYTIKSGSFTQTRKMLLMK
jgi:hypothetical protein